MASKIVRCFFLKDVDMVGKNSEIFKPIRCGNKNATPFLRNNFDKFCKHFTKQCLVADIGCGNMRNTNYLKSLGYKNIYSFDKVTEEGIEIDLRSDAIPLPDESISIILCQYVMCFLTNGERSRLVSQLSRIAKPGCFAFVELYRAKNGITYDESEIMDLFNNNPGGWKCFHVVKDRFILERQ